MTPRVLIRYCPKCHWLARAAWYAQELLQSLGDTLGEVALAPSPTAGEFEVYVDDVRVWSRAEDGGFPEAKILKRRVRDLVDPGHDLGHTDR